jgi:hypothetical protein
MDIHIIDDFEDKDESEEKLLDAVEKLPDDILFRMAGNGEERAVIELINRYPELGVGE